MLPILFAILIILLMVFSDGTLRWLKEAFRPVIYAVVIAYLLDSLVTFFTRMLRVRRCQGILLACIITVGVIGFAIYKLLPKILENISSIVYFIMEGNLDIVQIVTDVKNKIDNYYVQLAAKYILEASESVIRMLNNFLTGSAGILLGFAANIGASTVTIVTSFIINIYMLIEKDDILARGKRFIYAFCDNRNATKVIHIFSLANRTFKSFLNGKLLDSMIVSIICSMAFFVFKVPYAMLMGTIIGTFNLIPYFGPIIGSVPVVAVSFFVDAPKALTAMLIIIVVQQLDANFLDPKIVGGNVGVSPLWIIASVTVGGNLFGLPGMILGVPTVVTVKTIIEESVQMRLMAKGAEHMEEDKLRTGIKSRRFKFMLKK